MLSGNNSILSRAGEAKNITSENQISERVQLAYLAALSTGKGSITEQLLTDELDKEFGENGYELTTDNTTEEWVIKVNNVERFRVKKSTTVASTPTSIGGLWSDGITFIGLRSEGKCNAGEPDNYWYPQASMTIEDQTYYAFDQNHFIHISNYNGLLWDETAGNFVEKTGADVYLCWDDDYGIINSEQDLINYGHNSGRHSYWDIFDASSGAWLNSGEDGGK